MSFQAYLDNIKVKTGKTPEDFKKLAAPKNFTRAGEIVAWLKKDFGLGHGHSMAIAAVLLKSGKPKRTQGEKLSDLFAGPKAKWRKACDQLTAKAVKFGPGVEIVSNDTYVKLHRNGKKFAVIQPSSGERLELGFKMKGVKPIGRLEEAKGSWAGMVTHRVLVTDPKQVNAEVLAWLRRAYQAQASKAVK
jgi:hypothetical protein